ncbi:MAG: hypothetical protein KAJ55_03295 [Anaerolineales bacterium]|nr:hypothetical protein [Anaerolineales bacterium]
MNDDLKQIQQTIRTKIPTTWKFDVEFDGPGKKHDGVWFVFTQADGTRYHYDNKEQALAYSDGVNDVRMDSEIEKKKEEAKQKAITNLGRYKFMNFGYWAAVWIHLNQLSGKKDPSPFKDFVDLARQKMTYEKYQEERVRELTNKGEEE